ncbi:hypothetical protein HC766_00345 [Candidatus Gracilibacteria bacterium]|nr:hypothetical protein [Candidatus Gracilibacteria bacterium]
MLRSKRMFMSFVVKTILDDSSQIDMDYKQDGFEKFVIDFSLNHSASQYLLSEDRLFVTGEKSNVIIQIIVMIILIVILSIFLAMNVVAIQLLKMKNFQ